MSKPMNEQEREFERLKNKAKVWEALHPEIWGMCVLCPHLMDREWCGTNPRLVLDKGKNKVSIMTGRLFELSVAEPLGYNCLEWVRYV